MKESRIKILNKEGNLVEYKIILTFKCKNTNKDYIVYEGKERQQLFVANYDSKSELNLFNPINADDFDIVKSVLERYR